MSSTKRNTRARTTVPTVYLEQMLAGVRQYVLENGGKNAVAVIPYFALVSNSIKPRA